MSNFVARTKKAAMGALALAVVSTGFTAISSTSADAQWRPRAGYGHAYRGHRGGNRGAAVAAGVIGAIAAGAIIANSRPAYAAPAYSYGYAPTYGYAPAYSQGYAYEPAYQPAYQPTCYKRKVRQIVDEDTIVIRTIRECR
jgi:hypothetical protein